MSKAKITLDVAARMIDFQQACAILGRSPEWVRVRLDAWKAKGHPFPDRHPITENYDVSEVNNWLNKTKIHDALLHIPRDQSAADYVSNENNWR